MAIPQQLFFSGVVQGESAMQSEKDVGSKVKYEVTVSVRVCGALWSPSLLGIEEKLRYVPRVGALLLYGSVLAQQVRGLPLHLDLSCGQVFVQGLGHSWSSLTGHLTCWSGEAMRAQGSFFVGGLSLGMGSWGEG